MQRSQSTILAEIESAERHKRNDQILRRTMLGTNYVSDSGKAHKTLVLQHLDQSIEKVEKEINSLNKELGAVKAS